MVALLIAVVAAASAVGQWWRPDPRGSAAGLGQMASGAAASPSTRSAEPSASASPTGTALVIPDSFGGRWTGVATQRGGVVSSWTATFTLPAGAAVGTLEAPSLGCGATLTVVAPPPTDRELHLRQRTVSDPRRTCASAAELLLVINPAGTIDMFWQEFGVPTNTSVATLARG